MFDGFLWIIIMYYMIVHMGINLLVVFSTRKNKLADVVLLVYCVHISCINSCSVLSFFFFQLHVFEYKRLTFLILLFVGEIDLGCYISTSTIE